MSDNAATLNLEQADEVLREYAEPNSMIDNGNLFFAATEYKAAYEQAARERDEYVDAACKMRLEIDRLKTALNLCASQAGAPDASEACRLIIATVKQALSR